MKQQRPVKAGSRIYEENMQKLEKSS